MITIDSRLDRSISQNPGSIRIQVAGEPAEAVMDAMRSAKRIITDLDSGWRSAPGLTPSDRNSPRWVSGPTPARPGPVLYIDGGHMLISDLRTIPGIIRSELIAAGVTTAIIAPPGGELITGLHSVNPSLFLRLYPDPPEYDVGRATIPKPEWLEPLWHWLQKAAPDNDHFVGVASGAQFAMDSADAYNYIREAWNAVTMGAYILSGDPRTRIAALSLKLRFGTVSLAIGGPALSNDEFDQIADSLKDLARHLAPELGLGLLLVDPMDMIEVPEPLGSSKRARDAPAENWIHTVCNQVLFDAYPYQVLNPKHIQRLGGPPREALPLSAGRFELSLGQPHDWLQESRTRRTLQARGRRQLSRCLLSSREVRELTSAMARANLGRAES